MKQIQVGIIGCGVIAPAHIEGFQQVDGVLVAALCDLVPEKAEKLAAQYGIGRVTTDYRELLLDNELNAIIVCTDHGSHAQICKDVIRSGKHLLCEKPLVRDPGEIDDLLKLAESCPDLVCAGVLQHRFDAIYRYAQQLLQEGTLGRLLTVDMRVLCYRSPAYYQQDSWRGTWDKEGGSLLINQAIHFFGCVFLGYWRGQ